MAKHELWELQSMQAAPLSVKVALTKDRIREWVKEFGEDGVSVSFSGGKDSTVLLHLVREMYPDIPAVFVDVPTQYPELRKFAETFDNVVILRPKMNFMEVCDKYGFPLISKEVAECVQGARKYLTSVIEQMSLGDRQTDRRHTHTDLTAYVDWESLQSLIGGGYDRKWRKLRGIGEFTDSSSRRCSASANMGNNPQVQNWGGGEAKRFALATGILTTKCTVEPRLWKNYRQYAGSADDGNPSEKGNGKSGDYP